MIEVLEAGPLTTVQDGGRRGLRALGVPLGGPFDRRAHALANRLVGNSEDAAALELTLGGLAFHCVGPVTIALTGAPCPGAPDWGAAISLPSGVRVRLGSPPVGLRSYLAVSGGFAVPPVLGSRSTDTLSGLGPPPLRPGDRLPVGARRGQVSGASSVDDVRQSAAIAVRLGPRDDWFGPTARQLLASAEWTVRPESDRVGVRLAGPALERIRTEELPSEPLLPGALQVPPDGRPILFGPDAPVTGGYPVIAVALDPSAAAQLRPGDRVRFSPARGAGSPTPAPRPPPRRGS